MTPDLKIACELVFQEHKVSSQPIKWDRDAFRGRISFGLSEMAKETLVQKKIILLPNKSKKVFTQLNPDVAAAASFEEAEKMIGTKIPGQVTTTTNYAATAYVTNQAAAFVAAPTSKHSNNTPPVVVPSTTRETGKKWYMEPVYLYGVWPVCGAVAGALISFLMNLVYTLLF